MANDFQSIMKLLDKSNTENGSELYIKSLNVSSKFKKFTGQQSKDFVEILTKSPIFEYHFLDYIYNTLKDLSIDKKLRVENFTTVDRIFAIIQLRMTNIGKTVDIDGVTVDIEKHLESIQDLPCPENITFDLEGFSITLGYPNLKNVNAFEKLLIGEIDKFRVNDEKDHRMILSTIFLYNILSFIQDISYTHEDVVTNFNYLEKSVVQKIDIGKALPSHVISEIVVKIEEAFNDYLHSLVTISVEDETYTLELNPHFFLQ